jgi:hypothetical protein
MREVRGGNEREVLGAGRGVQAGEVQIPAMAAERREERRGREQKTRRGERRMRRVRVSEFTRKANVLFHV